MKLSNIHIRKSLAALLLVLFTAFVFTPTVVTMVKSDIDVSMYFSVVEEEENAENHKSNKPQYIKRIDPWALALALLHEENKAFFHKEKYYGFVMIDQFCPPPELS